MNNLRLLDEYEILIFDCDGVILDSNEIKAKAFYESVIDFGQDKAERFLTYHNEHGGVSRYQKFDYFFDKILKNTNIDRQIYINKYAQLVKEKLLEAPFTDGFMDFIAYTGKLESYVVSASDECELREVFAYRKIDNFFEGIYGSPSTKIEIIQEKIPYQNRKVLFIGDSYSDYEAANHFDFDFMYLKRYSKWNAADTLKMRYKLDSFDTLLKAPQEQYLSMERK